MIIQQIEKKTKLINVRYLNTTSTIFAIASKPSWGPWLIVVGIWVAGLYSRGSMVEYLNAIYAIPQFLSMTPVFSWFKLLYTFIFQI